MSEHVWRHPFSGKRWAHRSRLGDVRRDEVLGGVGAESAATPAGKDIFTSLVLLSPDRRRLRHKLMFIHLFRRHYEAPTIGRLSERELVLHVGTIFQKNTHGHSGQG